MDPQQVVHWHEGDETRSARWRSEAGAPPPDRVIIADDRTKADNAYRLARRGTALLWRGDYHNARQLLQAMSRRATRQHKRTPTSTADAFHRHRQSQSEHAQTMSRLLVELEPGGVIDLRRAPDVRRACSEAYGDIQESCLVSLRELLGVIGASEWHRKGVDIPALGDRIHPSYGVFAPVRQEYVDLVADAPLPPGPVAFDVGTGTGVLAAVLARRGVQHVVATDVDPRAVRCARENLARLDVDNRVDVVRADLFPPGTASLVVCNPPWIPGTPTSPLEAAIYDPRSRMLHRFLSGLGEHLEPAGEGWLVLSDLAEHLGLRSRDELLAAIDRVGLTVVGRAETRPSHPRADDRTDPLHAARSAETTSLFRLGVR